MATGCPVTRESNIDLLVPCTSRSTACEQGPTCVRYVQSRHVVRSDTVLPDMGRGQHRGVRILVARRHTATGSRTKLMLLLFPIIFPLSRGRFWRQYQYVQLVTKEHHALTISIAHPCCQGTPRICTLYIVVRVQRVLARLAPTLMGSPPAAVHRRTPG